MMIQQENEEIRRLIHQNYLKHWQVASQIGITASRFSVWLRTPLSDENKLRVEKAIEELTKKESL